MIFSGYFEELSSDLESPENTWENFMKKEHIVYFGSKYLYRINNQLKFFLIL